MVSDSDSIDNFGAEFLGGREECPVCRLRVIYKVMFVRLHTGVAAGNLRPPAWCLQLRAGRQPRSRVSYHISRSFPRFINEKSCLMPKSTYLCTYAISVSSSGKTSISLAFSPGVLANTSLPSKVVSSNPPSKPFIALWRGVLFPLLEGDKFALIARSGCLLLALRSWVLLRVALPAALTRGCVGGAIDLRDRARLGLGAT